MPQSRLEIWYLKSGCPNILFFALSQCTVLDNVTPVHNQSAPPHPDSQASGNPLKQPGRNNTCFLPLDHGPPQPSLSPSPSPSP